MNEEVTIVFGQFGAGLYVNGRLQYNRVEYHTLLVTDNALSEHGELPANLGDISEEDRITP